MLTVLIVAIVLNSTSSSDELDDDNDTGDNTYAGDTIMLDDGTNISSNQIYILSGIDGSVDEKTTISDVYDLYQSNSIAAEITEGDIIAATNYQFQFRYMERSYQELEWESEGELAGKFVLKADGSGMVWKSDR